MSVNSWSDRDLPPVDCVISFDEYIDQLSRFAEDVDVTAAEYTTDQYERSALNLVEEGQGRIMCSEFEWAFVFLWRAVYMFRQLKATKRQAAAVNRALDLMESLQTTLKPAHSSMMERVAVEDDRRRAARDELIRQEFVLTYKNLVTTESEQRDGISKEYNEEKGVLFRLCKESHRDVLMAAKAVESDALRQKMQEEREARDQQLRQLQQASAAKQREQKEKAEKERLLRTSGSRLAQMPCGPWAFPRKAPTSLRRGLVNLGNTCYLNSTLQCLNAVGPLRALFRGRKPCGNITAAYAWVSTEFRVRGARHAISPGNLKHAVARKDDVFAGNGQQDCHEFLRVLLDGMHEEFCTLTPKSGRSQQPPPQNNWTLDYALQQYVSREHTPISEMFGFMESSTLRCPLCKHESRTFVPSFTMLLPIPHYALNLYQCLGAYLAKETLPEDSKWTCSKCSQSVRAEKQLEMETLPKVLVITLMRFHNIGALSNKVDRAIMFPNVLELKGMRYRLVGTANHAGSLGGGHYTADVLGLDDGAWASFSDERVTQTAAQPHWSGAYVMYYVAENETQSGLSAPVVQRATVDSVPQAAPFVQQQPPQQQQQQQSSEVSKMEDLEDWVNGR
eukprot:PhM_4_TR5296/c0_g1_i1/m.87018/K11833/USP2; ubiquitin carboxyl-terminal hydrolase 2